MVIRDETNSWSSVCARLGRREAVRVSMATVSVVDVHQLAAVVRNRIENVLIIDSRSFLEYNTCHVASAVNVCCSKIVKRRLQQDKISVKELLVHTCHVDADDTCDVVVYDQGSKDVESLAADSFTTVLLKKLQLVFTSVNLLSGGFLEFQASYPELCEDKTRKCPPLTSLSQPCLPIANQGPTRILPFLYLGSQYDALNRELLKDHNITYELNVSTCCPQPDFLPEGHFMRISVNDNYSEKLLPHFPKAFNFLDKVREGSGCVLVHCLAGISRSPTVAIAYVMRYLRMTSDDAYRYVKSKRPTISPNFNFLGQLLEYEKQLRRERILDSKPEVTSAPPLCGKKRLCRTDMRTSKLSLDINTEISPPDPSTNIFLQSRSGDQSPTTALAKLSFGGPPTPEANAETASPWQDFRQYRSKSCYGDWLRDREDSTVEHKAIRESQATAVAANAAASACKPLSPVKEIKCEALISEISSGQGDAATARSCSAVRQRVVTTRRHNEEKRIIIHSTVLHGDNSREVSSTWSGAERFSVQTLSHIRCTPCQVTTSGGSGGNRNKVLNASEGFTDFSSWSSKEKPSPQMRASTEDKSHVAKYTTSACREATRDISFRKELMGPNLPHVHLASSSDYKSASLNPFSFMTDVYKRTDSASTSGFGSESSDCADNYGDEHPIGGYEGGDCRAELDVADEEDVIFRNTITGETKRQERRSKDSAYFSLILPEVSITQWPKGIESPLSPSETHLLEDLVADDGQASVTMKEELPSPCESDHRSEDPDSFHDSGIPASPPWLWPRKRGATFDDTSPTEPRERADSIAKDKRKYQPIHEQSLSCQTASEKIWQTNSPIKMAPKELVPSKNTSTSIFENLPTSSKAGLYRVQSCPGILTWLTATSCLEEGCGEVEQFLDNTLPRTRKSKKGTGSNSGRCRHRYSLSGVDLVGLQRNTDGASHESCPDVLHLGNRTESSSSLPSIPPPPHQRDFRRNVSMIQVS